MNNLLCIVPIVFGLMVLVNIITEVLKNVVKDIIPTNLLVLVLSIGLTITAMFIYLSMTATALIWWMIPIAIIVGFFVAYAAMFGFDKFQEIIDQWRDINKRN